MLQFLKQCSCPAKYELFVIPILCYTVSFLHREVFKRPDLAEEVSAIVRICIRIKHHITARADFRIITILYVIRAFLSGCLNDKVWQNKYLSLQPKVKIYRTVVKPVLTYSADSRADTSKTEQILVTVEIHTLRTEKQGNKNSHM